MQSKMFELTVKLTLLIENWYAFAFSTFDVETIILSSTLSTVGFDGVESVWSVSLPFEFVGPQPTKNNTEKIHIKKENIIFFIYCPTKVILSVILIIIIIIMLGYVKFF